MATVFANTGKAITTARLRAAGSEPLYVGWGTGAGTATATDTDLFTPSSEARVAGTSSQVTTAVTNDTYQVVALLTAAAPKTITNIATFDAAGAGSPPSGGNMYMKGDFTGIALNTGDSIQATCKLQYT